MYPQNASGFNWVGRIVCAFALLTCGWQAAVAGPSPGVSAVAAGTSHTLALKTNGTVWAWGLNSNGQLGDGTTTQRAVPVQITSLTGIASVEAGAAHTLALRSDGTVWSWGLNTNGQLGDGTTTQRTAPLQLSSLAGMTAVAGGASHSLALKSDGTVWSWGLNTNGQLGDGTTTQRTAPVPITALTGITAIAAGTSHSLALKSDGTVWAWGLNTNGQLGDGTTTQRTAPVQITTLTGITAIATGASHGLALKSDGTVWAWGLNSNGQLGDGTLTQRTAPVQITTLSTTVAAIAAGSAHSLAIKTDRTAWTWGLNADGQLGDGTIIRRTTPVQIPALIAAYRAAGGGAHTLILRLDGTIAVFGDNTNGQFGDGVATLQRPAAIQATTFINLASLSAGASHSVAIRSDQTLWAWGLNANGQLGNNSTAQRDLAVQITTLTTATKAAAGNSHTLALKADGSVWSWGLNTSGQLGDGTTTQRNAPVPITTLSGVSALAAGAAHSLALKPGGSVWVWGQNTNGQLGDGATIQRTAPFQLTNVTGITALAAGAAHTLALKSDGTVWVWGLNTNGQLGDGATAQRTAPFQLTSLSQIIAIAAGASHSLALKSDGTVWVWGLNTNGQLGDGATAQRTAPFQLTTLAGITAIAAGATHSLALSTDGTVRAWGLNTSGQLGDGTTIQRTEPVTVANLSGVSALAAGAAHSLALKTDKTLRVWGSHANGQLGVPILSRSAAAITLVSSSLDSDQDGLLDSWEMTNFGNLAQSGTDDFDGDGLTNIQEYVLGTDPTKADLDQDFLTDPVDPFPTDYFNNTKPTLTIVGGNNQITAVHQFNPLPFDVAVWNTAGTSPLVNAPVTFDVITGSGQLATTNAGSPTLTTTLPLRTDVDGTTQSYFQQPAANGFTSQIRLTAGTAQINLQTSTFDTQAPAAPTGLAATSITMTQCKLTWSAATDNVAVTGYDIYRDGMLVGSSPTLTFTVPGFVPSTVYSLTVKAKDAAGNISDPSAPLLVTSARDTQVPTLPTTLTASSVAAASFMLSWTASTDNVAVASYNIYKGATLVGSSLTTTFNVTGLLPTTVYSVTVRAKDTAGNLSAASAALPVTTAADTTPPAAPAGLAASAVTATAFTLTWTAATDDVAAKSYEIYKNGTLLGTTTTKLTFSVTGLAPLTAYAMTVKAKDAAGNISTASAALSVTTAADTTPPAAPTALVASLITTTTFTLKWTAPTDNVAVTGYDIFRGGVLVGSSATPSFDLTGLAPSTAYSMTVKARDAAGNISAASAVRTVMTAADKTAPSAPTTLAASAITQTGFTLTWTASTDNIGVTGYNVYRGTTLAGTSTTTTFNLAGLNPGTAYAMTVKAKDAAGNLSAASAALSVTTAADTVAPAAPTALVASGITASSFVLTWTASTDNVAVTGYNIYRGTTLAGSSTTTSFTLTKLTPSTAYGITVKAKDFSGNLSAPSPAISVTTIADTIAPTAPTGLAATNVTMTSFTLTWLAATDNVAVTGYSIYKNGVLLGTTTTARTFNVTGLTLATTYNMTVVAKDAAANLSPASAVLAVNTAADTQAPTVPAGLAAAAITPTGFTLTWTPSTDNVGVTGYDIYKNGVLAGSTTTATSLSLTGLTSGTTYSMTVTAKDAASISVASAALSVTTLTSGAPAAITGLRLWLQPETLSAGAVAIWPDQSGRGNNATQTDPLLQPFLVANQSGGQAVVRFDGTNDVLNLPDVMAGATAGEIIAVVKMNPVPANTFNTLWGFGTSGYSSSTYNTDRSEDFGTDQANFHPGFPFSSQYHVINVSNSAGAMAERVNGLVNWQRTGSNLIFVSNPTIGNILNGDIAEIIVYDHALSPAERENIGQYLAAKYAPPGIPVPAKPGLSVFAAASTLADVSWTSSVPTASTVTTVERQTGGSFAPVAELTDAFSYTDTGLAPSTSYTYRVRQRTYAGSSVYSDPVTITTPAATPPSSGRRLWLRATAGTQGFGRLAVWADQSGLVNHALQTDPAQQPLVVANQLNGLPVVRFDGVDDLLLLPDVMAAATAGEIIAVVKYAPVPPDTFNNLWSFGIGNGTGYVNTDSYEDFGTNEGNFHPGWPFATQYHAKDVSFNAGTLTERVNGAVFWQRTGATGAFASNPSLGGGLNGDIAEILIYDRELTPAERSAVSAYLSAKYGSTDTTAPTAPADLNATAVTSNSITLTWTAAIDDVAVTAYDIYKDGTYAGSSGTTSFNLLGLTPSTAYSLTVKARDAVGNLSTASAPLSVTTLDDTLSPSAPTGLTATVVAAGSFTLSWTAATDNIAVTSYAIYQDGTLIGSSATTTFNVTGLTAASTYGMTVVAKDAAGNTSAPSAALSVATLPDTQPPTAPTALLAAAITRTTATVRWTAATDDVGVTGYDIYNGMSFVGSSFTTSFDLSGLTSATAYSITVKARDAAGNVSPASSALSLTTVVDGPPAAVTGLRLWLQANTLAPGAIGTWLDQSGRGKHATQSDPTKQPLVVANQLNGQPVVHFDGANDFFDLPDFMSGATEGEVFIILKAAQANASGVNKGLWRMGMGGTGSYYPDNSGSIIEEFGTDITKTVGNPNVPIDQFELYNVSSATDAWTVRFNGIIAMTTSTNSVAFRSDPVLGRSLAEFFAGDIAEIVVFDHALSPVERDTIVSYLNARYALFDAITPSVPTGLAVANLTTNSFTLTWAPSTDNVAVAGYYIYQNGVFAGSSPTTSFTVTGLTVSTTYAMTVKATDGAGNTSDFSAPVTATTAADPAPPPAPTGLTASSITATMFTLSWTTSTDNVAITAYDIYRGGTLVGTSNTGSFNVTGLVPLTPYSFTVKARDAAGRSSPESDALTVSTVADTFAPSVPVGLAAPTVSLTSVHLTWSASTDDVGIVAYDIYVNGVLVASVSATSFVSARFSAATGAKLKVQTESPLTAAGAVLTFDLINLDPGTFYNIEVRARDGQGNTSDKASVTAITPPDTEPPTAPAAPAVSSLASTSVTLTWPAATDNVRVTGYNIYENGVFVGTTTTTNFSVTGLGPASSYIFTVRALDASGNVSGASASVSLTTPAGVIGTRINYSVIPLIPPDVTNAVDVAALIPRKITNSGHILIPYFFPNFSAFWTTSPPYGGTLPYGLPNPLNVRPKGYQWAGGVFSTIAHSPSWELPIPNPEGDGGLDGGAANPWALTIVSDINDSGVVVGSVMATLSGYYGGFGTPERLQNGHP